MTAFLSCFSGIEAASVAWATLGWHCVGVAELDPTACAVLAHHYPHVPNLGDVTADNFLERAAALKPDVLIGGPPCQDFSVAGLRAGIHGARGNLTLRWVQIIHAVRARFSVTENVPGWLSANGGRAFGAFLAALVGHDDALNPLVYGFKRWSHAGLVAGPQGRAAWRTLDAQYFGLAQRRKRVFVVFCPRGGGDPAEVLFEREGVQRHTPPRRKEGKDVAPTISSRPTGGGGLGTDFDLKGGLISHCLLASASKKLDPSLETYVVSTLTSNGDAHSGFRDHHGLVAHSLRGEGFDASEDGTGRGTPLVPCEPYTLAVRGRNGGHDLEYRQDGTANALLTPSGGRAGIGVGAIAYSLQAGALRENPASGPDGVGVQADIAYTVEARAEVQAVSLGSAVRRLTPKECARLQGFPDDYLSQVMIRGKPMADGPQYKCLGNSMAVPVIQWIGQRISGQI